MMRQFILVLIALLFISIPHAPHAATCTLDEASVGSSDPICPVGGENNFLPGKGFNILRLQPTNTLSATPINVGNQCRFVDARGTTDTVMIPLGSTTEWVNFLANRPSGTNAAPCCIARSMLVSDVPRPTDTCNGGFWNLQGIVASVTSTDYIAKPQTQRRDAPLILVAGQTEDASFPIDALPFERDDVGATLPTGARASESYLARWQCLSRKYLGRTSGDTIGTAQSITGSAVGVIAGEIGDITFTNFKLQCRNAIWTSIDPAACVETITAGTRTCAQADHPSSWVGNVEVLIKKNCPNGNLTVQTVYDSCKAPVTCTASGPTVTTVPCGTGFTGNISRSTSHVCDGSNNGAGKDVVTDDKSQCVAVTCTPGQVGATFTESCGENFTGTATYKNVRSCPTGGPAEGVITKTLDSNTCACPASFTVPNVSKACPSGQTGSITVTQNKTCQNAQPSSSGSGGTIPPWGICSCGVASETETANTCTGTCVPGVFGDTFTVDCPNGQSGVITKRKSRTCPSGTVTDVEISNTCSTTCVPGLFGDTFTAPCPTNNTGIITKRKSRTCPSGAVTEVEISNTCKPAPICVPGEISRSAVSCGINKLGSITTINTRVCDGSNNGEGKIVTTTENTCRNLTCVPSRTQTQEACPDGQDGYILVVTKHVCHSRIGWKGWEECTCGGDDGHDGSDWWRLIDGGERDIIIRENHCVPKTTCTPSDVSSTRACPDGYQGQILVRAQHICDGSNGGLGRDQITETNQCATICTPGPVCNPYNAPCPSGQTGVITRQNFRTCPTGQIEIREISNTCRTACIPTDPVVTNAACPSGQVGNIVTTTRHVCDGSNGGAGRDIVTTDNQCRNACTPSVTRTSSACPSGQTGNIITVVRHICDGSNNGLGRDSTSTENNCRLQCTPNISLTIEDCAQGYTGGRTTKVEHICDGSNGGAGRDVTTVTGQACRLACTPNVSISVEDCAPGYTGGRTTKVEHICDGSNGGAGRDVTTVTGEQCRAVCTPSSRSVDASCPAGQQGYVRTTTNHICDGSNGGAGRDVTTTDNQCRPACVEGPTCNAYTRSCPYGQAGYITVRRIRQCPSGNEVEEVISNTCHPVVTCNDTSQITTASCPSGQWGAIFTTRAHICDGSNGGLGRDVTSVDNQCVKLWW